MILFTLLCSVSGLWAQQITISIGTGDDDLREGSKVNISVIYFNPARGVTQKEVAEGRRFADRTTFTTLVNLPAGTQASNIQEIQLEYIPDPASFPKESDKWWFTRFLAVYQNGGASTQLFENNSVARKFEARGTWSTGVLPTFSVAVAKKITVFNDANQPAVGTQVYLKLTPSSAWTLLGSTNSTGEIVFTQNITSSSVLVARQRIHEQNYYRSYHDWNSSQNWNYRVYLTNLDVNVNGSITPNATGIGTNNITLRVRKANTLIGCNLLASAEWDLSTADVNEIRSKLKEASDFLYNATDGQLFFEQVTIFDRAYRWDDSDFRIYNSTTLRANVPYPPGAFLGQDVWGSCMKLARNDNAKVYAHEFGHYGLVVRDEYSDDDLNMACSPAVLNAGSTFTMNTPMASCMMFDQSLATKICSSHPLNPHIDGTRQGSQSCWDKIKSRYNWSANWRITSPVDKGGILPTLVLANGQPYTTLPFLNTAFNEQSQDAGGAGVIRTHIIRTETATGGIPVENVEISTISPVFSLLGTTNTMGTLAATGIRTEVEVLAMHTSGVGAVVTINPSLAQTIIPLDIILEGRVGAAPRNNQPGNNIRKAKADAQAEISMDAAGKLLLSVKTAQQLKGSPVVSFILDGVKATAQLKAGNNTPGTFTYNLPMDKVSVDAVLLIKGEYEDNTLLRQTIQLSAVKNCPEEIFALNGLIAINKGGRPVSKGSVLLYSTRSNTASMPAGAKLIGLPFVLKSAQGDFYSGGGPMLEIRLPREDKGSGVSKSINSALLKVYKYDEAKKAWYVQAGFKLNKLAAIFAGRVSADGIYMVCESK